MSLVALLPTQNVEEPYTIGLAAPSAINTALALRQAIWRKSDPAWPMCGIPEVLYSDHGSDFTSRHLEQVCAELHVRRCDCHSCC